MTPQLIACGLIVFACNANAQSSVSVFGVVDAAARHSRNGSDASSQIASGGKSSSRFGIRGFEDLGGGLRAGFVLDAPLALDTGTVGLTTGGKNRFWQRRTTLSLISRHLGELRIGRDSVPTWSATARLDTFSSVGPGSAVTLYPDANAFGALTRTRADNILSYHLPQNSTGVSGSLAYSFAENTAGSKHLGGQVAWTAGKLKLIGAFGKTDVTAQNNFNVYLAGAIYDFGRVRLNGMYQKSRYAGAGNQLLSAGIAVREGRSEFKASLSAVRGQGVNGGVNWAHISASQAAVQYSYVLSKRTDVYATLARLNNHGSATYVGARIAGASITGGASSTTVDLGIRHQF